ncbi:hypothetical protein GCM10023186_35150 [Hymenobacter koreensis]|uniref:Secreted protein n=2 Tax=Hymenobacter koreensis TaxID=1084523 RepID=A0ABP8JCR8_9BACT
MFAPFRTHAMRFFSVFFALYLAILACLPCADEVPTPADGVQTYVEAPQHNTADHGVADWCSPLCQCHCCAGTSLPSGSVVALPAQGGAYAAAPRFARLTPPPVPERSGSIWQPPQA